MNSGNKFNSGDEVVLSRICRRKKSIISFVASLFASSLFVALSPAHAVPASPAAFKIQQPDGSVFSAVVRGDEFQNWTETTDGYTVVKNSTTGAFEYAVLNDAGQPVPSGVVVVPDGVMVNVPQNLWPSKHLRPARNVELEQFQERALNTAKEKRFGSGASFTTPTGVWAPTPVSGSKKILMILVNFTDATLQSGAATYWGNVVHSTSSPSVAKYYQDVSFGVVSVAPVASTQPSSPNGVVTVNLAQAHPNCGGSCSYTVEKTWINSALAAAAPYVNFAALDVNFDGTISVDEALVYFVLAGYEASAGSTNPSIWAHAWGGSGVSVSGKTINHWALNGERYNSSTLMTMGVVTHEMGHAMGGLPDLYDTSSTNSGLGIFSLMASGSWGAKTGETGGTTPVGLDAWSRQYLGWSTPREPANGTLASFSSPLSSPSAAVMLINSAVSTSEYWLVENRPPVGWDAGMARALGSWTGGLLIQHIDLNIGSKSANSFNRYVAGSHQGNMAVEPSTKTCSLVTPGGSWGGCASLMYYAGNSTSFSSGSNPTSNYYSGAQSNMGVTGVSAPSGTMTASIQSPSGGAAFSLTTSLNGSGSINSSPAGISCGSTCSASFTSGTNVTLTATPETGYVVAGWGGACVGTVGATCGVSMTSAKTVSVSFATASGTATPTYRFKNPFTGGHFFTSNESEKAYVLANLPAYQYEGFGFYTYAAQATNSLPIYRFSNSQGFHYFTISETEKSQLMTNASYRYDGTAFYGFATQVSGTVPVYRFRNSITGSSFYTALQSEYEYVLTNLPSYVYQNIVFYVRSAP